MRIVSKPMFCNTALGCLNLMEADILFATTFLVVYVRQAQHDKN